MFERVLAQCVVEDLLAGGVGRHLKTCERQPSRPSSFFPSLIQHCCGALVLRGCREIQRHDEIKAAAMLAKH